MTARIALVFIIAGLTATIFTALETPKPRHHIYWCSGALTDGRQIFYVGAPCKDWPSEPVDV